MIKTISVEDAINSENNILIDVRASNEYNESTIPGAINIPLFTEDEREEIGILYKDNKELAYERGIEIGSSKLYWVYKKIKAMIQSNNQKVIIFCWRGGMRSKSIVTNLDMMGINVFQLKGGYKAYRKYIVEKLDFFHNKFLFYNLHGNTGVGKTILLNKLQEKGEPVLDLEGIANNRGSIFGSVGLGQPRSQKMFDSLLFNQLNKNKKNYFFIESESRRIGNILLPDFLVSSMKTGKHILVEAGIEQRIKNIMQEYLPIRNKENIYELINNNKFIIKKMGRQWTDTLLNDLKKDDYYSFIKKLLLDYYDPLYSFSEKKYEPYDWRVNSDNIEQCVETLIYNVQTHIDRGSNV